MSGNEIAIVESWVQSTATTASAMTGYFGARVYGDLAPLDAAYPFVVWSIQEPSDVRGLGNKARILVDCTVLIRAVASTATWSTLAGPATGIDATFDGATGATSTGLVISSQRTRPYTQVEEYESDQIRQLGGFYRVLVQST